MNDPRDMGPPNERWMVLTDDGPEFFSTEEEARDAAADAIADYCDPVTGWDDSVEHVVVAKVIAYAGPTDVTERPSDDDLDEEGYDSEGYQWQPDQENICEYELLDVPTDDDEIKPRMH